MMLKTKLFLLATSVAFLTTPVLAMNPDDVIKRSLPKKGPEWTDKYHYNYGNYAFKYEEHEAYYEHALHKGNYHHPAYEELAKVDPNHPDYDLKSSQTTHPDYLARALHDKKHRDYGGLAYKNPEHPEYYEVAQKYFNHPEYNVLAKMDPKHPAYLAYMDSDKAWSNPAHAKYTELAGKYPHHPAYKEFSTNPENPSYKRQARIDRDHPGYRQSSLTDILHPEYRKLAWSDPEHVEYETLKAKYPHHPSFASQTKK